MAAPRISVQLYSLREEAKKGLAPILERLGRIGYAGVEPAGLADLTPAAFNKCLADAGLVVSSGHTGLPKPDQIGEVLDQQQAIGVKDLVVAFLPPDKFADADGVKTCAERLNAFNEKARARGISIGYHNHWWEFQNKVGNETAHALLFRLLDPSVFAEVDTYWAKVGGVDPAKAVAALGERARLLHIKDGPAQNHEQPMTAVGEGTIDVGAIAKASKAKWHIVELDQCATDMFTAIEKSHRYLTSHGYATGRG
ncbi:MAG TPA: sugar phosphate isomerase/epimerase [Pseudomonadales bacterium]|nr:sugar phosphate isomerase/epimerase [Pseudomonadales bacterium]